MTPPSSPAPRAPMEADRVIADAARRYFDYFVQTQPGRSFPWMPHDLLTALVEDYDRRALDCASAPPRAPLEGE